MRDKQTQPGWRTKIGFVLFVLSIAWPAPLPILPIPGLSGTTTAAFSDAMPVAAELMILAGAAIAGKDGFKYIKSRV